MTSLPPTTSDWARAVSRMIAEAYGFETGEHTSLSAALAQLIDELGLLASPRPAAVPVGVADEAAGRYFTGTPVYGARLPPLRDQRIPVEAWADFVCQFIGLEALSPSQRAELWGRLNALLSEHELDDRPVVWLSEALQQALPGGPTTTEQHD